MRLRHLIAGPIVLENDKTCGHSIAVWRWAMNIVKLMLGR
jgi:hypothetical protein